MGRQFGVHHCQRQPRGITPPGEESHQPAPFPLVEPVSRCRAGAAGQASTYQFGGLSTIVRDVDVRHRISDVDLRNAFVPQFSLERPARPATPPTASSHPFRGELSVVDQPPHPDAFHCLVDSVCGVILLHQPVAQFVLTAWPIPQQPQRRGGGLVGLGGQRREVLGGRGPRLDRGDGRPELVRIEPRALAAGI